MEKIKRLNRIGFVATFPPRKCGIATFTKDLVTAIDKKFNSHGLKPKIIAMNENEDVTYNYSKEVIFQIDQTNPKSYFLI